MLAALSTAGEPPCVWVFMQADARAADADSAAMELASPATDGLSAEAGLELEAVNGRSSEHEPASASSAPAEPAAVADEGPEPPTATSADGTVKPSGSREKGGGGRRSAKAAEAPTGGSAASPKKGSGKKQPE